MGFEVELTSGAESFSNPMILLGLVAVILIVAAIIAVYVIRYFTRKGGQTTEAFKKKVILITLPKDIGQGQAESPTLQQVQEKIAITETFLATIAGLPAEKGMKTWFYGYRDVFSLEIVADKEGKINFLLAMPAHYQQYVEEQIHAQFSNAFIEEITDYNIFSAKSVVAGRTLRLGKDFIFPIKTYKDFEADPLNAIANALSKIDDEDGAAIQIVIKSARSSWHNLGSKVASKMQQGKKLDEALAEAKGGIGQSLKGIFKTSKPKEAPQEQYRLSPMEEDVVKKLEEKSSKAGMDVNVRIIAASENQAKLEGYLNNLVNAFSGYNIYKYGNGFKSSTPKVDRLMNDFIYRHFNDNEKMVLNTEEVASLFHLPIPFVNETPNIRWLESKKAAAPGNVPEEGVLLGKNIYRGKETLIRIKPEDRVRHMYVIGMTGVGKSYMLSSVCMQDIKAGKGVCYIDPHGDDLEEILARVPKERAEDVIFFDPSDVKRPVGLNLLEFTTQEEKTFVINELMAIFDKLYDLQATGGPMFEQYFKNAAALIMSDPESGSTMLEISRVLSDDPFRRYKLAKCTDQLVKDFWEKEALKAGGEASLQNMVPYITSKMSPFISNDFVRPIISQQKSTIDFADAMNNNKILLIKLSKGKIGANNAYLLGMVIVGKILMSALARGDMPAEERKDFYLYIDEFQNFLTDSMEIILSEARKYKLSLNMAHQYIGQLTKGGETKFKDAIFGNVGTKISFRVGVDDAESLAKEFAPTFSEYDFLNVPKYNCFCKLLIDNANPAPFNMATLPHDDLPVAPSNSELAVAMKELSRLKYGKDPDVIAMEIKQRQNKKF
jgi:hypothetical protein